MWRKSVKTFPVLSQLAQGGIQSLVNSLWHRINESLTEKSDISTLTQATIWNMSDETLLLELERLSTKSTNYVDIASKENEIKHKE